MTCDHEKVVDRWASLTDDRYCADVSSLWVDLMIAVIVMSIIACCCWAWCMWCCYRRDHNDEAEFMYDELAEYTPEQVRRMIVTAVSNFESYHDLPTESCTIDDVLKSPRGLEGWAAMKPRSVEYSFVDSSVNSPYQSVWTLPPKRTDYSIDSGSQGKLFTTGPISETSSFRNMTVPFAQGPPSNVSLWSGDSANVMKDVPQDGKVQDTGATTAGREELYGVVTDPVEANLEMPVTPQGHREDLYGRAQNIVVTNPAFARNLEFEPKETSTAMD